MISPKMLESEGDIFCCNGHNQKCISILFDSTMTRDQRYLCSDCLEYLDQDKKVIGIRRAQELIFEQQTDKIKQVEDIINPQIYSIEKALESINESKQQFFDSYQQLISGLSDWIGSLKQQIENSAHFSFYEELDSFISQQNCIKGNIYQLNQENQVINQNYHTKLRNHLEKIHKISLDNVYLKQLDFLACNSRQSNQEQDMIEQQLKQKSQIRFKQSLQNIIKVDQDIQNFEISFNQLQVFCDKKQECESIAFNYSQQIMISADQMNIQVWNFDQGKIELEKTLTVHSDEIFCLMFSKKHNSFISAGADKSLIIWKQNDNKEWIRSEPYIQHTEWVMCLLFNQSEDLVFSGSKDTSIIVWSVNLEKNELAYKYSLKTHKATVISLSLSESENLLVSCGVDTNSIIIWESNYKSKFVFEFKYYVKQSISAEGLNLMFINDTQFIWITGGKQFDQLWVFEMDEGIFKEKSNKKINLKKNDKVNDECHFPIVYNKERNILLIKHKTYIYIIRPMNTGDFSIIKEFNCDAGGIYGTMTNTGSYLVYWKSEEKSYVSHELLKI
ncbi:unnamed protein product [Paramecium octaurelia]|uniref:IP5PC-F beta-propeller domain-containing protein n=1 Tax=Paramecium octaurelia TaxID=43137 RepID=A0A8S1YGK8_PAROT|nr:unnamed protein product [Paramecium octaurelia]